MAQPKGMLERGILGGGWTHGVSLDLYQTLPVGGDLLVLCSLPGLPVIKQLMQMVTREPGQGGWFQSVLPLTTSPERLHTQDASWESGRMSLSSVTSFCYAWT